jgi:hypothetical protein
MLQQSTQNWSSVHWEAMIKTFPALTTVFFRLNDPTVIIHSFVSVSVLIRNLTHFCTAREIGNLMINAFRDDTPCSVVKSY